MEPGLIATLLVLALVDATSVGTLGIPVWLGLQSRVRTRSIGVYLGAVAGFYLAVGLVLYAGALAAVEAFVEATEGDVRLVLQLLLGVALFALSFKVDPVGGGKGTTHDGDAAASTALRGDGNHADADADAGLVDGRERGGARRRPSRIDRLKDRVTGERFDARAAVVLALGAASVELLMMLPFLAAIGMLADAAPAPAVAVGVLAGYVAVMIVPAAVLLGLRVIAEHRAKRLLAIVHGWVDRHAAEAMGWALGVGGFFLVAGAVRGLGIVG